MKLVRRERTQEDTNQSPKPPRKSFFKRLRRALGPILPGLMLDIVDLITWGPIGIYAGIIIGFPLGYWICSQYKLSFKVRIMGACAAGIYCMVPFTSFAPVGTIFGVFARFLEDPEEHE